MIPRGGRFTWQIRPWFLNVMKHKTEGHIPSDPVVHEILRLQVNLHFPVNRMNEICKLSDQTETKANQSGGRKHTFTPWYPAMPSYPCSPASPWEMWGGVNESFISTIAQDIPHKLFKAKCSRAELTSSPSRPVSPLSPGAPCTPWDEMDSFTAWHPWQDDALLTFDVLKLSLSLLKYVNSFLNTVTPKAYKYVKVTALYKKTLMLHLQTDNARAFRTTSFTLMQSSCVREYCTASSQSECVVSSLSQGHPS